MSLRGTGQLCLFGAPERSLVGFFHAAHGEEPRNASVVMATPIGWEGIALQRTYRVLAEQLASAGFATLRFDLPGTGDSAGDDADADRLSAWRESLVQAAAEVRRRSGAADIFFVGFHVGGTLAALAAEAAAAQGLVLWGAFAQGKQLLRQVRAYRALNPSRPGVPEGAEEAAGFLLSAQTVAALGEVDLTAPAKAPAPRVLLLENGGAAEGKLVTTWEGKGAQVTRLPAAGFAEMLQEPRKTVVPLEAVRSIVRWAKEQFPQPLAGGPAVVADSVQVLKGLGFEERFHVHDDRFGIVTVPTHPVPGRPAIVFLNTASDHRVGPSRMYVRWARALAAEGFASVRFDPAGIGDSPVSPQEDAVLVYSHRRLRDARAVVDWIAQEGIAQKVVLIGLCSGAYVAYHLTREDERVVGELLINPQTFFWREGDSLDIKVRESFKSSRFYRTALMKPENWQRLLNGKINVKGISRSLLRRVYGRMSATVSRHVPWSDSPARSLLMGFRSVLRRGAQVLLVFGADDGGLDVVEGQLGLGGGALQRQPNFRMDVLEGPNHTFSNVGDQAVLFARVVSWIRGHWA